MTIAISVSHLLLCVAAPYLVVEPAPPYLLQKVLCYVAWGFIELFMVLSTHAQLAPGLRMGWSYISLRLSQHRHCMGLPLPL